MQIYADPITVNCRKVLAGLQLMGIDYALEKVDYFKGEQKLEPFTSLNPNCALPALKDGDFVLWESNAMLAYAADKHNAEAQYPKDLQTRADINRWLLWESSSWFPSCYIFLVEYGVKPLLDSEPDQAIIDAATPRFHQLAGILDQRLTNQTWLCGTEEPTIADIAVAAPMHLHALQHLPLDPHPHLRAWMTERIETLPCWIATQVNTDFSLN